MKEPIIHTLTNDYYGTYGTEFVGVIDFAMLMRVLGRAQYDQWTAAHVPFKHFGVLHQIQLHDHIDQDGRTMHMDRQAIFVPTKESCKDWDYRGTQYANSMEEIGIKKIKLPMINSRANILKWQNSLPDNLLMPSWTEGCQTVEDLKREHDKFYPSVCRHCYHGRI